MPSLGVRGSNPIWAEFDLAGKIFDDSYYMYVLSNVIPYIPLTVYHDPDLNTAWTNPIQFLGNGTLPNDIFFVAGTYRLEFRQSNGLQPPSQNDPLIYLVENYEIDTSGSGPIIESLASDNQISNPQFAVIDFASPFTLSATDPAPIQIGPDWFLELAGTGTVTLTQQPLTSTTPTPSNAPYALEIDLTGWTNGSVFLRQRFQQSGVLWANQYISTAITARVQGANSTISAQLVDSQANTLGQILPLTTVDSAFTEFTGNFKLPASIDTDTPPAAYIDYKLALPSNVDIFVTSIQVVVENMPVEPTFIQDSINRQIDHLYHDAYPIMPVGGVIPFAGFSIPAHYLLCDGRSTGILRTTYNLLFQALTKVETVTLSSGVNTFTVASAVDYYIGMDIEGTNIPSSTTITNISGTTVTMSNNASGSGLSAVRFFAYGNGDGSTTFNLPNYIDQVLAGANGTMFAANHRAIGSQGGSNNTTFTIVGQNLPANVPLAGTIASGSFANATVSSGSGINVPNAASTWVSSLGATAITPSVIQQTTLVKYCIRFE